jgi:CRISPR-associated endonuclease/helicase Cas3
VQEAREALNFPDVGLHYRMIPRETVPVVVPYGSDWPARLRDWRHAPTRRSWQRLQPYLISLYEQEIGKYRDWLEEVGAGLYRWRGLYDSERHRGVVAGLSDPSDLIV